MRRVCSSNDRPLRDFRAYIPAAYLPPGRRFRGLLEASFPRVETTHVVYQNFPPAFVYRCQK